MISLPIRFILYIASALIVESTINKSKKEKDDINQEEVKSQKEPKKDKINESD